ncbi:MAG: helix-turn-helix transcriptional regulator [Bacteroidetes bacterium]|nr:helix-turn-helix transcriptional regulator [Bacteroidota bacterium]MDA0859570.1 helix-turn-helix transcriptional regulator [Bacteroidota bacterium]MDA1317844.1 helix-turn-helix transcriptional regulator [Bacteroidota bacterium]
MMNTSKFGEQLNKIIVYYGLSASAFAELIQVQRSSISHILSGRNKPSLDFILKLNTAFPDINLYWLLNGTGDMLNGSSSSTTTKDTITQTEALQSKHVDSKAQSKKIERIVIFYKDGTFEGYCPEITD